jgi:hypothetical protein
MWSTHSRLIEPIRQAYCTGLTLADALKHSIDVEAPRSRLRAPTSTRMARPGRPEQSRTARSSRQLRRFLYGTRMRFSVRTGPRGAQRCDDRERAMMRWGMPPPPRTGGPPFTNIRDISLPHWRVWRTSSNRKLLAPNRFQSMGTLHHCKLLSFLALMDVGIACSRLVVGMRLKAAIWVSPYRFCHSA